VKKPASMRQIGRSIADLLDPLTAKRSNVDLSLALAWQTIAGEKLAGRTQPEKIQWPPRNSPDDAFQPGTLTVAAEGSVALDLQYRTGELISAINQFFGYHAINRIRIEQKPVLRFRERKRAKEPQLPEADKRSLDASLAGIEDEGLKAALLSLGTNVIAEQRRQ
jgi:hypothetical protein